MRIVADLTYRFGIVGDDARSPLGNTRWTANERGSSTAPAERSGDGALEDAADSKAVSTLRYATAVHEGSRESDFSPYLAGTADW